MNKIEIKTTAKVTGYAIKNTKPKDNKNEKQDK